jgi:hypothetical protein
MGTNPGRSFTRIKVRDLHRAMILQFSQVAAVAVLAVMHGLSPPESVRTGHPYLGEFQK